MPNTTNGLPFPVITDDNNPPADIQALAEAVDNTYGGKVASAGALPTSGLFPGQRIWLVDVKGWAEWSGTAWNSDTAWVQPTLGNSWASFDGGATLDIPAYCRVDGVVWLKGAMKDGTGAAFTLPVGMRPLKVRSFTSTAASGAQTADVRVSPSGVVTVPFFGTGATNGVVSLDSVRFLAEQ
jgi:hypothetical protein